MDLAQLLLAPRNTAHRQYEALRAYLVDRLPGPEVARRFGYTYWALQQLVHQFRREPNSRFFVDPPRPGVKTDDAIRQRIVELRKQNLSIYDISRTLRDDGDSLSPAAVSVLLHAEGFARLPRRLDEERPPGSRPTTADIADVRQLDLSSLEAFNRQFTDWVRKRLQRRGPRRHRHEADRLSMALPLRAVKESHGLWLVLPAKSLNKGPR